MKEKSNTTFFMMCKFTHDFSTGIPLNILIIYGKDPNFKKI